MAASVRRRQWPRWPKPPAFPALSAAIWKEKWRRPQWPTSRSRRPTFAASGSPAISSGRCILRNRSRTYLCDTRLTGCCVRMAWDWAWVFKPCGNRPQNGARADLELLRGLTRDHGRMQSELSCGFPVEQDQVGDGAGFESARLKPE